MLVYTMGPIRSRPFTNALHASVGVGFLAATFLVRPFLPDEDKAKEDRAAICNLEGAKQTSEYEEEYLHGVSKIAWPFLLTGGWTVAVSAIYYVLGCLPLRMPRYYEEHRADDDGYHSVPSSETRVKHWIPIVALVVVYYALSCGIERIYQPMAYTYGLCGPLLLSPKEAVVTDSSYNGGFMAGRIVSIFLVKYVRPRNMILASLVMCVASSAGLCALASSSKYLLYSGTGLLGFFISWQFGSCYSWVAQKMDITGRLSPIFFVGCGVGGCIFPPLTGFVFTSDWGPDSILYLTLIACVMQCCTYGSMWTTARIKSPAAVAAAAAAAATAAATEEENYEMKTKPL